MIQQGEIYLADLNPTKGSEQKGIRPVIIISGNSLNNSANIVIVFPITTQTKNYFGDVVIEPNIENNLENISEILVSQIRTISKERLLKKIGIINNKEIKQLIIGLNKILLY